jgi:hypothetical protein|tara:strand:- start:16430 stop:16570 length:141 start_codon:yes stop_codon:yes gene_type:complete
MMVLNKGSLYMFLSIEYKGNLKIIKNKLGSNKYSPYLCKELKKQLL